MDLTYLKGVLKYIVSAVISVIIVWYVLYHLTGGYSPSVETSTAVLTTAEETLTSTAVIMRNEQIIYSTTKGNINYLVDDEVRVPMGQEVAQVFSSLDSEELCNQIITLTRRISLLESSNMTESEKRSDTEMADKYIWNYLYSFIDSSSGGNMTGASSLADSLLIQLNKRKIITGGTLGYAEDIKLLTEERERLYSRLSQSENTVVANAAGYFYSYVDGYESVYSSNNISLLTYAGFRRLANEQPDDYLDTGFGYPVGKVVTDYVWYAACEVSYSELHYFETGTKYDIRFPQNNDTTVEMTLYRILYDVDSDTAVLVFQTGVHPGNFSYSRKQTVQIVRKSYTGYRVPTSSVHIVNGSRGVYILTGTKVQFMKIDPLFEYDGYFIVRERSLTDSDRYEWLNKGDLVIVKGKNLYDGKIID
ncbi:MAG: hypothetical protein J5563_08005 [Clostridia bacterium]|nr:hypothetical protein [Clostridia bacterium]